MIYDTASEFEDAPIDTGLLQSELISIDKSLPTQIYIIPIRFRPIFPGIVSPLVISNGRFADAVEKVLGESRSLGLVLIKDDEKEDVTSGDLYSYGTVVKIIKKMNLPDGGVNVLISSVSRFKIKKIISETKYIVANIEYIEDTPAPKNSVEIKALTREVLSNIKIISDNNPLFSEEMRITMLNVDEPGKIADFVASIINAEKSDYQDILETINVKQRLEKVLLLLNKEMQVLNVQKKIHGRMSEKAEKQQRDFYLREELKAIRKELGLDEDDKSGDVAALRKKAEGLKLKGEAKEKIESELNKLAASDTASPEYGVCKNYLDVILGLPWNTATVDDINIARAERILNKDHYGLDDVKKRIVEFLAVRKLKPDAKGSVICLVGPPGVGKTSLGHSIAKAMNKKFFRLSLGGMRDEAEIKGHRRTYVGSMPGKIIQGMAIAKSNNPVFMLDEIDKMGQSFQGDPAAALLEVLDPEQNVEFRDQYLDVPFDLSNVLFITTANTLDTIPQVLVDRMEVISLSGYIAEEKCRIAKQYLLPKQTIAHGLPRGSIKIDKAGFMYLIDGWAREAGVRGLERQIEKICRKTAAIKARRRKPPAGFLLPKHIDDYLGAKVYADDDFIRGDKPGLATGLAWTSLGGVTLTVEALAVADEKNLGLKLTGQLGEVMSESANIAYTHVKSLLQNDPAAVEFFGKHLIHLHVPAGATPKDGPSAGITMAVALYSLITGKLVKKMLAMTGELSLTGQVLPIGGVKEKIIAAKRAKMKHVILPLENKKDFAEIANYLYKGLSLHFVKNFSEVLDIAI